MLENTSALADKKRRPPFVVLVALSLCGAVLVTAYIGLKKYQSYAFQMEVEAARIQGNWDKVAYMSLMRLNTSPHDIDALRYAAEASFARGSIHQAAELYEQLPPDDPRSAEGFLQLGLLNISIRNKPLSAEGNFLQSLALDPGLLKASRELLLYYGKTFQASKATKLARSSILAGREAPIAYVYLFSFEELVSSSGASDCERWLTNIPKTDLENRERFEVAYVLHKSKAISNGVAAEGFTTNDKRLEQQAQQQQMLLRAHAKYPENFEVLAAILKAASDRGDQQEVAKFLALIPASASSHSRAWRYKGWLHREREEYSDAETSLHTAVQRNHYDWKSRTLLGEVLRLQGKTQESQEQLNLANTGHELETSLLNLNGIDIIPPAVLEQMRLNAERVGDDPVERQLAKRLEELKAAIGTESKSLR